MIEEYILFEGPEARSDRFVAAPGAVATAFPVNYVVIWTEALHGFQAPVNGVVVAVVFMA